MTIALAAALPAPPARAQASGTPVRLAQLSAERTFDIPAQPLANALILFGRQSGIQVTVHGTLVRDIPAPEVRGTMSSEDALIRLLFGSGLTYVAADERTVAIEKPGGKNTEGATMLNPITVEGQGDVPRQAQIGALPAPYAGGQVATGGSVGILGNRDVMDTPFSQTSYTSKLAQDQNARTLDDVVQNDPAVRKGSSPGNGIEDFSIRGFEVTGRDFLLNGLPAIAPTNGAAMMVESVERVEVLKGPNALLNGIVPEGGVGGAINVIPKRATDEPVIQLSPDYAMDSQFGGHVDVGRRFGPDKEVGVRMNGVYRAGDTPIDHQSREQRLAALGLDYRGKKVRVSSDLGYQHDDVDGVRRGLRVNAGLPVPDAPDNRTNYNNPFEYQTTEVFYGTLQGEVDITPNMTAFATIGANRIHQDFTTANLRITGADGTIGANSVSNFAYVLYGVAGNAGLRSNFDTGPVQHQLVAAYARTWREWESDQTPAVALQASNLYNLTYSTTAPASADFDEARKRQDVNFSSVVFGDTMSVLDERVQLTFGLRRQNVEVRRFNTTTGAMTASYDEAAVTPMVGILGKPLRNLSLYANYIEGLQEGSTAPTGTANQGEVLPPFVAKQYEVGAKWDIGRIAATLAAFQITQPSADTDPVTNIFEETGEQRHRGIELNVFGEVMTGVRLLGGATYIDAVLTKTNDGTNEGNEPPGVSPLRIVFGAEWDTPFFQGFTLMGRVTHDSSNYLDAANTQKVPGWARLDVGARYRLERADGKPIVIRTTVTNVLDSDYWVNSSSQLGLSEPLTFRLSASFDF